MRKEEHQVSEKARTSTIAGIKVVTPGDNTRDDKLHTMRMQKLSGQWKQHMGSAKIAWGKLTQDQLLKTEGHYQKLVGLVEETYAVTKIAADKQVRAFMDKNIH